MAGSAGFEATDMASGCIVLCDLKHDNEQLYAISIVYVWRSYRGCRTMGARK